MKKIPMVVSIFLAALGSSAQAQTKCTIGQSLYESSRNRSYTLSFVSLKPADYQVSDTAIRIESKSNNTVIWYYFDQGAIPRVALISTTNPTKVGWHVEPDGLRPNGTATFVGMDNQGNILDRAPKFHSLAPKFIVIPELAEVYRNSRHAFRPAAFVFKSCR